MSVKEDSINKRSELAAIQVVKNLQSRNFEAFYCKTGREAVEKAISLIPEGASVTWGGSVTIQEIGLIDELYKKNFNVVDRDKTKTVEERWEIMRQGLLCDTYLASTNAITEDGILVNIDANGNRVAAMTFGPKNVIVIAGVNKICKTLEDARSRARNYAAPINIFRLAATADIKTPCVTTGICGNCKSPDCICCYFVETRMCRPAKRIKVILVGESLGF
ncbi:MAG: lactate utilization protein [Fusobacteriaceae bacterium]|jgi:L-lactate utilization protein LutB|nr:lactate utilization protein [Fusobacteriaceae bacterium]